ncbi:MAG: sodium:panthothenate symporter [Lentisphaeria bacterium]|nr:sodium:panthothenate symporter [Lentisphaeria bacterium]
MYTIDWFIIWIPLLIVLLAGWKSQKYVRGVADFLTAGRVAGRYVVSVASGEAAMGLITAVAVMEMYYQCGFSVTFWSSLTIPISMMMGLFGFCTYRYRETRCMTLGQFFEVRYSKSLRVTASVIQSISGIVNYAIFPAIGARFLIYFLDLPLTVNFWGWHCPTFGLTMVIFLGMALYVACRGGQITIMVTDCVQGLLSYPMYLAIVIYILCTFSWGNEMAPAMMARPPHESFLSPYDISNLREFNLFYVIAGIVGMLLSRLSWGATMGYNGSARSPHEAKMGGLLGTWRSGFSVMIFVLLSLVAYTYVNHAHFAEKSRDMRSQLAAKTIEDIMQNHEAQAVKKELLKTYKNLPAREKFSSSYASAEEFRKETEDPFLKVTGEKLGELPRGKKLTQSFRTIYSQMLVPVAVREILPAGLTGIFCALMIFLMLSTDTTYMHAWGSIIVQDFVVPLRKKAFTPPEQLRALRWAITGVCVFAFVFSLFFSQLDYILMFFAITGAIWAGAGIVITLGLYWKRGTTAGAYAALISGAVIATSAIIAQQLWASDIYPALDRAGMVPRLDALLDTLSRPFHPYIVWRMNPLKFPINSAEIGFICTMITILLYVGISLATCKEPFDMDRMLFRGRYSDREPEEKKPFSLKRLLFEQIVGIDKQYTTGDKVLAWSVFGYSFVYSFGLCFVLVVIWNFFTPWPIEYWVNYFFIKQLLVAGIIALISTFWFGICGTKDLLRLYRDLDKKTVNELDDGRVIGHVSAADMETISQREKQQ